MMIPNANGYSDNPRALASTMSPKPPQETRDRLDRGLFPQLLADELDRTAQRDALASVARHHGNPRQRHPATTIGE